GCHLRRNGGGAVTAIVGEHKDGLRAAGLPRQSEQATTDTFSFILRGDGNNDRASVHLAMRSRIVSAAPPALAVSRLAITVRQRFDARHFQTDLPMLAP